MRHNNSITAWQVGNRYAKQAAINSDDFDKLFTTL